MEVRHKVEKNRIVTNVTWDIKSNAWVRAVDDVGEVYTQRFWEQADIEQWSPISVTVVKDGAALMDKTSHIAGILNSNYRFLSTAGSVVVEKLK